MGIVNGIVAFGSSMYTIILSIVLPIILESLGIKYTFLILGGMYCMLLVGTLTWKPLFHRENNIPDLALSKESIVEHFDDCCSWTKKYLNVGLFKNRAYLFWFLGLSTSLFGYFVPFVHLVSIFNSFWGKKKGTFLVMQFAKRKMFIFNITKTLLGVSFVWLFNYDKI